MSTPDPMPIPMPGDKLADGRTVIASNYGGDDGDQYDVLVLNPTPEFYSLLLLDAVDLAVVTESTFRNIIPAAEAYDSQIGGI